MRGQGRHHRIVTVDGNVAVLVASPCIPWIEDDRHYPIIASPSRLYSEVYDSECHAHGIATPHRIVRLLPCVTISRGRVG